MVLFVWMVVWFYILIRIKHPLLWEEVHVQSVKWNRDWLRNIFNAIILAILTKILDNVASLMQAFVNDG